MSVKVGEVLDPDVNPFYQIIGKDGETNKIRLREGYSRSHVFTKGNTYKVSVKSPDVGEVGMHTLLVKLTSYCARYGLANFAFECSMSKVPLHRRLSRREVHTSVMEFYKPLNGS